MTERTVLAGHGIHLVLSAALIGACATPPTAQSSQRADPAVAVALPPEEEIAFRLHARGTQNYECRAKEGGTVEWVFVAPEADLFDSTGAKVGKHYAGPTWESTVDGSKFSAKVKASAPAPEPDAIPWLLLAATQMTGDGMMGRVKSVQRADTHGGTPPAGACSAGQAVKVPYTAVYSFSRAKP